jgi:hypothetical protein
MPRLRHACVRPSPWQAEITNTKGRIVMLRQQTTATDATLDTAADPDTTFATPRSASGTGTHRDRAGLWIAGIAAALLIAATAVLVWQVSDTGTTIDSFDVAEQARMQQLATGVTGPADGSFETAEKIRLTGLAPTTDTSFEAAETTRMTQLAPTTDTSFETAETTRMTQLAPATDTSFEAAEATRMTQLAPATDNSHQTAERARMTRLAP